MISPSMWTVAVAIVVALQLGSREIQTLPRDLGDWQIAYSVSGGIAGGSRAISVSRAGEVTADDRVRGQHVVSRAGDEVMAAITAFLPRAAIAQQQATRRYPAQVTSAPTLTSRGRRYDLAPSAELAAAL